MAKIPGDRLDWIKPDRNAAQSMQVQIAHWLQTMIAEGNLRAGDRLPPETILTERLGVSRVTLRLAIDELVGRGQITRSHGRGSFVTNAPVHHDLLSEQGFFDSLLSNAREPEARLISYQELAPPAAIAVIFGLTSTTRLPRIERLYMSAGRPIATTTGWLAADAAGLTYAEVEHRSTATIHRDILRRPIVKSTIRIGAELAGQQAAKRLAIRAHAPVLVLTRSRFDKGEILRDHSVFTIDSTAYEMTLTTHHTA